MLRSVASAIRDVSSSERRSLFMQASSSGILKSTFQVAIYSVLSAGSFFGPAVWFNYSYRTEQAQFKVEDFMMRVIIGQRKRKLTIVTVRRHAACTEYWTCTLLMISDNRMCFVSSTGQFYFITKTSFHGRHFIDMTTLIVTKLVTWLILLTLIMRTHFTMKFNLIHLT